MPIPEVQLGSDPNSPGNETGHMPKRCNRKKSASSTVTSSARDSGPQQMDSGSYCWVPPAHETDKKGTLEWMPTIVDVCTDTNEETRAPSPPRKRITRSTTRSWTQTLHPELATASSASTQAVTSGSTTVTSSRQNISRSSPATSGLNYMEWSPYTNPESWTTRQASPWAWQPPPNVSPFEVPLSQAGTWWHLPSDTQEDTMFSTFSSSSNKK